MKIRHCFGLTSRIRKADGIAPRNGPKNGMMFVTPTTTLTSGVYGRFRIEPPMKQRMPMMSESRSLPRTKPLKISSVLRVPRMTRFAARSLRTP